MILPEPGDRTLPIRTVAADRLDAPDFGLNGYFPFLNTEIVRAARPAIFIGGDEKIVDLQFSHTMSGRIGGAGLSFIPDGSIAGHGFVIAAGRLLLNHGQENVVSYFAKIEGIDDNGLLDKKTPIQAAGPVLSVMGPGYAIWGHWLLDFLPRLALAQHILGKGLSGCVIPLPADAPPWTRKLLSHFCGVTENQILPYDRHTEYVSAARGICIPDDLHTKYNLHSGLGDFYKLFMPTTEFGSTPSRICVSRSRFAENRSVARSFPLRQRFEAIAAERGYEMVHPEDLSIREMIAIFARASSVVGEFGSGMHNTLFSPPNCVVGQFVVPSHIQSRIAGLRDHRSVFLLPENSPRFDSSEPATMETNVEAITKFFDAVEEEGAYARSETISSY